ncbi:hypothetical protein D6D01_05849 [Aureobasidium pullulans]|uniref:Concanavalin A-like lectin/glucanase n=1 Tax=Aureobasidium pullulans TaxID=5580 RepID=A0A4V6TES9_AURPU|nr:hypothetical protein D6D01_05849 [Aureobasidium pullulans]
MKLLTIFGTGLAFASGVISTPIAANVAAQHYGNSLPTAISIDNAAQSANEHALNEIGVDGAAKRTRSSRDNWAGGVLGVDLKAVTGTFVVPSIAMPPGVAPEPQQGMSVWVGTHGDECPGRTILQTGLSLDMADGRARYGAWFEWYPQYFHRFDNISFSVGDSVTMTVNVTSKTGGIATIKNNSKGTLVSHIFANEATDLCPTNADWIVEKYSQAYADISGHVSFQKIPIVNMGTVTFTNASATTADGKEQTSLISCRMAINFLPVPSRTLLSASPTSGKGGHEQ